MDVIFESAACFGGTDAESYVMSFFFAPFMLPGRGQKQGGDSAEKIPAPKSPTPAIEVPEPMPGPISTGETGATVNREGR